MHGLNFVTRSLCPGRPFRSRRYSPHALPERRAWKLHKTERGRRSMDNCRQPSFKKPMKNNPVRKHLLYCCAGSAISALLAFSFPAAEAGIHLHGEIRMPAAGQAVFLYDPSGFPIWGYSPCGRPIYAYTPAGAPIYVIRGIYRGCHVPAWNPRPHYHGPFWPAGVCRVPHAARFRPCPPPVRPHRPRFPHERHPPRFHRR